MTLPVEPQGYGINNETVRAVRKGWTVLYDCDHPLCDEILFLPSYIHYFLAK